MAASSREDQISSQEAKQDQTALTLARAPDVNSNKNYFYYFRKKGRFLACVVESKTGVFGSTFAHSLIDTLYVISPSTDYKTELAQSTITFCLGDMGSEQGFKILKQFIERLHKLGILELHENPDAVWFYTTNGGDQILNSDNYPAAIQQFLKNESAVIDEIIKSPNLGISMLIEVGCGKMVNLQLAKQNNIKYLGLEISPHDIRMARERIVRAPLQYKDARVECIDILTVKKSDLKLSEEEKPLLFLPFNLFGNIAPIALLLARFRRLGIDVAVSLYKTDDRTKEMRKTYYSNCGYNQLTEHSHPTGSYFRASEGLYTVAYDHNYLMDLFEAFGFKASMINAGDFGVVLYARPLPLLDLKANPLPVMRRPKNAGPLPAQKQDSSFSYSTMLRIIAGMALVWSFYKVLDDIINSKKFGLTEVCILAAGIGAALEKFGKFKQQPTISTQLALISKHPTLRH